VLQIFRNHPDCYFQVFTNGHFITDEVAAKLRKLGNVTPLISVEGTEIISDERRQLNLGLSQDRCDLLLAEHHTHEREPATEIHLDQAPDGREVAGSLLKADNCLGNPGRMEEVISQSVDVCDFVEANGAVNARLIQLTYAGLGSGSTAAKMLDALGERLVSGALEDVAGVPTSAATAARCGELGIPLLTLDDVAELDVVIDGADEIGPHLDLIKGLGGAHLREKVVASAGRRMVVVADETKLVSRLGERAPLPVEVIPFALPVAERLLRELGWEPELRVDDGRPFVTDEGNRILHCTRAEWVDPAALARDVSDVPGVVAHGFFLGFASVAVVATRDGVRVLERDRPAAAP
jgi:ribose 5-phosphate isomerase A